ncbi:LamG domain-containing protein, partial [Catenulispora subtropica]|uniref:LamG domain-containing protein n=1 Tax=Catenulispora subtropica TaxID=450798 RepID=UPI0031E44A75
MRRSRTGARVRASLGLLAAVTAVAVAAPSAHAAPPSPGSAHESAPASAPASATAPKAPSAPNTKPLAPDEPAAAAAAKSSGKEQPILSLTTETGQVLVKPDGSYRYETYARPVRVKQNGAWTAVDTTLVRRADGTVGPKAASGGAVFSGGGSGPAVTIAKGDEKISVSWPAPLPAPVLDGPAATYPNVLPGVDLVLTATDTAYSEVLVVHDATAATNPALKAVRLRVTGTDVTVRTDADGGLTALDARGREAFHAPAATMWDSTSSGEASDKPSPMNQGSGKVAKLKTSAETPKAAAAKAGSSEVDVTLTAPDGALTGPGVKYPVFIDPWFTGWNSYWISISTKGFDSTYNSGSETRVGYCGWSDCNNDVFRTYFDMNIDGVQPRNGVKPNLTSAWFYLTQDHVGGCTAQPTTISEAGWVTGSTTWPGPLDRDLDTQSSDAGGNSSCPKSAAQIGFNVTSGIQDAIWYNWPAISFGLHAPNEGDKNQWKKFWNNPHIDIDYDYPPGAPSGQYVSGEFTCNNKTYVTNNTNFTVNAVAWDNNPSPLPLKYWFEVLNSSGTRISWNWNYAPVQTSSGAYGSWQTNYGTYPNGDYSFRTTVENVPQNDPAPPSWAYTNAAGENDGNYTASIGNAPTHAFTVLNEAMPSPTVKSFDYPKDTGGNPVWGPPQGVNGQLVLGNAGNGNTVGYAYAIDSGGAMDALTNDTCSYDSQRSAGGAWYGLISDSGGKAALTVPAGLAVGHHTLWVKSFDAAHNMSATATRYEFFIAPNYNAGPVKFEAEDTAAVTITTSAPSPAPAPATSVQNFSPDSWSGGKQVLLAGREVGDKFSLSFTTGLDAYYALGVGLSKATDYGKLTFDVDGTPLRADAAPFNGYASALATAHVSLGGTRLKPGKHKLTLTVTGTDPATANSSTKLQYQGGVDYLSATPVNGVAFPSFAAAMNNHGISDDTATAAADMDFGGRNPNGDVGGAVGSGASLSKQALAAAGLAPGTAFTLSGMNFTMPDAVKDGSGATVADNVVAMGQTITLDPAQRIQADAVGLLVASTCGATPPSGATIGYADGLPAPDSPATSGIPDWITGTAQTAAYTLPYRNTTSGKDPTPTRLYLLVLPADPGGVLDSVTLPYPGPTMVPGTCPAALHVLAVGVRPAATANLATSADTSGGGHPLTLAGNLGFSTDRGGAAVFSGQAGQVAKTGAAVLDTTKSFSVSAWAKPAPGAVNGVVATQDGTTTGAFMLYVSSTGTWKFAMPTADASGWNADAVESSTPAAGNAWAHLVAVYDAGTSTMALYVNGTLIGTQAHANPWSATGPFALGRDKLSGAFNAQFSGEISGVRAYQRALSAADVSSLFGGGAPSGAVGVWPLNDFGRAWLGAWAATPTVGATASGGGSLFPGQTVRQTVHPTTYGSGANAQVRVRLTNRFGTAPLTVTAATPARGCAAGTAASGA